MTNIVKVKTESLNGPALDWAVAKCEEPSGRDNANRFLRDHRIGFTTRYSENWSQGGPIIEREKIYLNCLRAGDHYRTEVWEAWPYASAKLVQQGVTPLIAAMRCYVASKLGDEIEIPKELA